MEKDIYQHEHIVFGFEHYNPLGIVRSLGENGIAPIGIIVRDSRKITSNSKYFKKVEIIDSIDDGYKVLIQLIESLPQKPFVYSSDDQIENFLDCHYDELNDKCYFFQAQKAKRVAYFQNKVNILQLALKHGLNVLETTVVNKGEIPSHIDYPIITKAIISTFDNWKDDMIICWNEEDLRKAYKVIKSPKVLLQKYIEKKNELCLDGFSVDKGEKTIIAIASTYNYLLHDSYSPYMIVHSLKDEDLCNKLKAMIQDIGFVGIFSIEFLIDKDDRLYFLEINFRNSTWSYAATVAGMPMPFLWSKGMLEPSAVDGVYKLIESPFNAMVEFDDYRNRVKSGQISLLSWLKDFKNSKCKYYCSSKDYKPVISVVTSKFKKLLRGGHE